MVESKLSNFQSNKANNLEGLQNIIFDRPGATVAPICNCSQLVVILGTSRDFGINAFEVEALECVGSTSQTE